MLLRATRARKDAEMQWASVYLQGAGRAAEARMGLVWWHASRQSHAKDRAQSRGGVTGFHETWEEGEGDGIAQCTRCSYMRSPEDIWLRYNAWGTHVWENE